MELEADYFDSNQFTDSYSTHPDKQDNYKYYPHFQEILLPEAVHELQMEYEFNENFLIVQQEEDIQQLLNYPNKQNQNGEHLIDPNHIRDSHSLSQSTISNQIGESSINYLNQSTLLDKKIISQTDLLSNIDCISEQLAEEQRELQEQEKRCIIFTQNPNKSNDNTENKSTHTKSNEKYIVKSIVAVDLTKKPSNFEFKYGERPYVIINPLQGFYFISGDVCIMNTVLKREFTRFSELNSFKSPVKTYSNEKVGTLEVDLNNKRSGIKNFQFIINKLRSYSSQRCYSFAQLLEKYQKFVDNLQEKTEILQNEQNMHFFSNYLDESYANFLQKCQQVLTKVAEQHTFYSYTINRLNLFNFEMEMRKYGYSETLLALLGLDVQQAQQYIWRRGLFDYMDKANIEDMLYQYISYTIGEGKPQPHEVTLHTFDGLEVMAVNNIKIFMNVDPKNPFVGYNEVLLINIYDVSQNMIKQVMELRKQNKDKSFKYMRELEEDLSYSMEATIFLEKYYKNATQNFLPSNKRAGYRLINQQQNKQEQEQQQAN
ncbi:hypothetical protein TTHERM_00394560 (macronuclear) [Tetrahymena thermophila SB210]|uniref:Uncharacterized protein n=1 Tax=Tetrahymena thermophila (strain SB210) TaxID=312017 RepID=Q232Z7_TETTS|nr:hypothetical protein TTHERM_00394560 [Tetrahymena thermophila SB210]EAR91683.1 hypothetical protein TTHERM_00394560 [Tetrahymena thermophila SB210]|eukprot:XP_001011928.1 hypothetical protein TTHERM_00394560 [Tetrahymena thermophila SB210]